MRPAKYQCTQPPNLKNPHTYIYMQPAKYQCTEPANFKNLHTYIQMQSTYITINVVFRRLVYISNYNKTPHA